MPAGTRPSLGRDALLVSQVAVALVLIMVAQLFVRSTSEIRRGLGFDLDGVAVLTADLERAGFGSADRLSTFHLLAERVVRLPHVEAAALASQSLLDPDDSHLMLGVTAPGSFGSVVMSTFNAVSPSYFDVVGTRLVRGRAFTREDAAGSRPVMIVSDSLARRLWPGRDATGLCAFVGNAGCVDVVGVSESRRPGAVRYYEEEFFVPLAQASRYGMDVDTPRALFVRPKDAGDDSLAAIAAAVRGAVPDLPFVSVARLSDRADAETRSWRLGIRMFGLFGGVAVLLAGIGVYGSLAGAVRRRTPEIAIRMALGARLFGVNYFGRLATIILAGSDRRGSRSTAVGLWTVWAVLAPSKAGEGNALSRRNKPARRPPRHRPADGGSRLAPTPTRRSGAPSPNRRTARRPRVVDGRDAPVQAGPQGP